MRMRMTTVVMFIRVVALVPILGSDWFPVLPFDPIGGAHIFSFGVFLCFILLYILSILDRFLAFYRHLPTRPLNIHGVHFMKR